MAIGHFFGGVAQADPFGRYQDLKDRERQRGMWDLQEQLTREQIAANALQNQMAQMELDWRQSPEYWATQAVEAEFGQYDPSQYDPDRFHFTEHPMAEGYYSKTLRGDYIDPLQASQAGWVPSGTDITGHITIPVGVDGWKMPYQDPNFISKPQAAQAGWVPSGTDIPGHTMVPTGVGDYHMPITDPTYMTPEERALHELKLQDYRQRLEGLGFTDYLQSGWEQMTPQEVEAFRSMGTVVTPHPEYDGLYRVGSRAPIMEQTGTTDYGFEELPSGGVGTGLTIDLGDGLGAPIFRDQVTFKGGEFGRETVEDRYFFMMNGQKQYIPNEYVEELRMQQEPMQMPEGDASQGQSGGGILSGIGSEISRWFRGDLDPQEQQAVDILSSASPRAATWAGSPGPTAGDTLTQEPQDYPYGQKPPQELLEYAKERGYTLDDFIDTIIVMDEETQRELAGAYGFGDINELIQWLTIMERG